MALHTFFWVVLCASDRSIDRFEDITLDDPGTYYIGHPAPMVLAIVLNTNRLERRAMAMYELAYRKYPDDPRNAFNFAAQLVQHNRMAEALPLINELAARFPEYPPALRLLYQTSVSTGNRQMAVKALTGIYRIFQQDPGKLGPYFSKDELAGYFMQLERYYESVKSGEAGKAGALAKSLRDGH
jgi:tetratricopeptide (TPR) repeat protein